MHSRDIEYIHVSAARYASTLFKMVQKKEPHLLIDKCILGAIVEARSCERFAKLIPHLDDELAKFYFSLLKSENRHYQDFLKLASQYTDAPIDYRSNEFLLAEKELIEGPDALITLIYHRQLGEEWEVRGRHWQKVWGFPVIGRARKLRLVLERDYVTETLNISGKEYHFKQYENGFTQPNAGVCEQMVSWAVDNTANSQHGDLMEMYCGNGNFSIPMAGNFKQALGTEISRTSVKSAQENINLNNRTNLKIARMASEDLSKSWVHNETNRKFEEFGIDDYEFDTVLVDPPRAGLDEDTVELTKRFRRIVYISCNPESMVENIEALKNDYKITAFALFDQFPYTHHMEAGVILERND